MALLVLISSTSFAIDMHFCGDILVDTAVFKKANNCGMDMEKQSSSDCMMTKKNCCSDEQLLIEGQDELQLSVDSLSLEQQHFLISFACTLAYLFQDVEVNPIPFENYQPPLVEKDIHVLYEVYLI